MVPTGPTRLTSYDLDIEEEVLWISLAAFIFTVVRWLGNFIVLGHPLTCQNKNQLKKEERLFEEIWLMVFSFAFLVASWWVFFNNDVGASIFNTLPIVHDWPNNRVTPDVLHLLRLESGWYLHQVTREISASGVPIDNVMFYHHIGTLVIILFGFYKNLLLMGVLTVCVFNVSNPFLHLSKVAHVMDRRREKLVLFGLFALTFFLSRMVLFPMTVMKIGYVDAYKEDYESFGSTLMLVGNVMFLLLYGLQGYWLIKILRVLGRGKTGTTPKKTENKGTMFSDKRPTSNGRPKDD